MLNKDVVRKVASVGLIICLLMVVAFGVTAEDESLKKGFMLPGMGALLDGTEAIRGGVEDLIGGNEQLVEGLDSLGGALDQDIAGNLGLMKSGIDGQMVPGLDAILHGITGQVVPGMRDLKAGIDDKIVPGLNSMKSGIDGKVVPGLTQVIAGIKNDVIGGLDQLRAGMTKDLPAGLSQLKGSLQEAAGFMDDLNKSVIGNPNDLQYDFTSKPAVLPQFGRVKGYMLGFDKHNDMSNPTSLYYDIALWGALTVLPSSIFDGGFIELPILGASGVEGFAPAPIGHIGDGNIIAPGMVITGPDPAAWITVRAAVGAHVMVKQLFVNGALSKTASGIGVDAPAGIDKLQGGLTQLVGGVDQLKGGLTGKVVPGLSDIRGALANDVSNGLGDVIGGLSGDISNGLGALIAGFTNTESAGGYAGVVSQVNQFPKPPSGDSKIGVVEGLTMVRLGLSNPGSDPDVSDGLGLVIGGIRNDVLDGIGQLKGGITEKILPGLQDMNTGIRGQLQPGFSKVSMLLLIIWLVTLVVLLVVGFFIGRAKKAKVASGHGASM